MPFFFFFFCFLFFLFFFFCSLIAGWLLDVFIIYFCNPETIWKFGKALWSLSGVVLGSVGLAGREISMEEIPYKNDHLLKLQIVLKDMKGHNFCTRIDDNAQLPAMLAELRVASGNLEMDGSSTRHFDHPGIQNADVIRCGYQLYLQKTHSAQAICAAIIDLSQDRNTSGDPFGPVPVFDRSPESMNAKLVEFTRVVELMTPKAKAVSFLRDPLYLVREPVVTTPVFPIHLTESKLLATKKVFRSIKPIGIMGAAGTGW